MKKDKYVDVMFSKDNKKWIFIASERLSYAPRIVSDEVNSLLYAQNFYLHRGFELNFIMEK